MSDEAPAEEPAKGASAAVGKISEAPAEPLAVMFQEDAGPTAVAGVVTDDDEDRKKAVLKIQALQRGRQSRKVLAENDLEGARAIFSERHMMWDAHMEASTLARGTAGLESENEQSKQRDAATSLEAHKISQQHKHEEEVAAVRMQCLYRGFRDRKEVRTIREDAEVNQRSQAAEEKRQQADSAAHDLEIQNAFQAGGVEKSYISSTRYKEGPSRRSPGKSSSAPKAILTPTLVDKKANMTATQKKACIVLEEMTKNWATSYARSVEMAPNCAPGALDFVALFSKPSKEEPIAWPVVRVYLSMTNDFEQQIAPQVTYHLEGEKMKFDTKTDLGRRFKESWLDRIVMDKRAIRADMALRHKK